MLSIGDFARLGRISVRMLRHYDGICLLQPARVDPVTGYRSYAAAQLSRLNRILALKDLGFTLEQVRSLVDDEVGAEQLRGMLRLRQVELVEQISADQDRLARVERRLRTIESEGTMSEHDYVTKPLDAVRVAAVISTVDGLEEVGRVVGPNFEALVRHVRPTGPAVAFYDTRDDGTVLVGSAVPYAGEPGEGYEIVQLEPVEAAATLVHRGGMATIGDAWQGLARAVEAAGRRPVGIAREVYLSMPAGPDDSDWVTELQQPLG